jgi:hypothetical protein
LAITAWAISNNYLPIAPFADAHATECVARSRFA